MINTFKNESNIIKPSQDTIDLLKTLMEQIDNSISTFKQDYHTTYEQLNDEEKLLTKEIDVYDKKIIAWSNNVNENVNTVGSGVDAAKIMNQNRDSSLLKEVIEFDKFLLTNGGHNGGWEEIDHNLFLKIRNKYKAKIEFLDDAESMIAIKSRQQIEDHEEWYKKYLGLNEAKKEAIKKWRQSKLVFL
jgi:hypothetical protein